MRAGLIAALAVAGAACGGGGSSPPPPPPPGPNAPPTFTSPAAASTRENAIGVVYRPVAADPEGGNLLYAIGGPDAARFTMNPVTREVRFAAQPDFEAPADSGANNVYDISFTASDGVNVASQNVAITVTNVASGFRVRLLALGLAQPIFLAGLPDGSGRVAVVERAGRIRIMDPATGALQSTDFLNITSQVTTVGEMGLLAIAFSPNFLVDRTFYIHMNAAGSGATEIRQYRTLAAAFDQADPATSNVILRAAQPADTNHKGGFLDFDRAGRLLISLGDGGGAGDPHLNGQNPSTLLGKILRIDVSADAFPADDNRDYTIPTANPFAVSGGAPEIWAMGLRNPFRGSVDPVTGDVLIGDVGQDTIEEVDKLPATSTGLLNFGWNRREGSLPFLGGADDPSFLLPVTEYRQGPGNFEGRTVIGGPVYRGPVEDLQGLYVFGDNGTGHTWTVPASSLVQGSVLPTSAYTLRDSAFNHPDVGNIVAYPTDTAGNLYFVDISGELYILEPLP
jgi:glucose/arabinose dehydrogenase